MVISALLSVIIRCVYYFIEWFVVDRIIHNISSKRLTDQKISPGIGTGDVHVVITLMKYHHSLILCTGPKKYYTQLVLKRSLQHRCLELLPSQMYKAINIKNIYICDQICKKGPPIFHLWWDIASLLHSCILLSL